MMYSGKGTTLFFCLFLIIVALIVQADDIRSLWDNNYKLTTWVQCDKSADKEDVPDGDSSGLSKPHSSE